VCMLMCARVSRCACYVRIHSCICVYACWRVVVSVLVHELMCFPARMRACAFKCVCVVCVCVCVCASVKISVICGSLFVCLVS